MTSAVNCRPLNVPVCATVLARHQPHRSGPSTRTRPGSKPCNRTQRLLLAPDIDARRFGAQPRDRAHAGHLQQVRHVLAVVHLVEERLLLRRHVHAGDEHVSRRDRHLVLPRGGSRAALCANILTRVPLAGWPFRRALSGGGECRARERAPGCGARRADCAREEICLGQIGDGSARVSPSPGTPPLAQRAGRTRDRRAIGRAPGETPPF